MSKLIEQIEDISGCENITCIQFGILSPDAIRKGSVVEITSMETYDGIVPKTGGLFDRRMGVIEEGSECATCRNTPELCPGHFGHVELALPVYNQQFIETIIKVLRCVCFRCSNLLINKSDPGLLNEIARKGGKGRFNVIYNLSQKIKICKYNNGCNIIQPKKYYKNKPDKVLNYEKNLIYQIGAEFASEAIKDKSIIGTRQVISPQTCLNILRKISADDCEFMGFSNKDSRPEWMMITVLAVPPPAMRPSVRQDNNQRSEDDLTYGLVSILKDNKVLKQKIESNCAKNFIDTYHGLLQYHVATFMDNEIPGIPSCAHRSGRCLKSVRQRQVGKDGRLRCNIMGKRVDGSGRSVITVDPSLSIDEFGVPQEIAMNLTFPEVVTKYNINEMYKLVKNGPNIYPGAKSIKKIEYDCNGNPSPCVISLKYVDLKTQILHEGDIVNRHLQNGDVCLFNRQPSLHRMSMMGMKAKILPGKTFKLNVSVTTPFNADFDGDEMNVHVPASLITHEELKNITLVPTQIISPSRCKPIITLVQDTIVGAYLMTQNNILIDKNKMDNMLMNIKTFSGILPPLEKNELSWTGKKAYQNILPEISLHLKNESEQNVIIRNGIYQEGVLDKSIIGGRGLIQDILNTFGTDRCHLFLDETQNIITRWLESNGFSVGIGDAVPINKEMKDKIESMIDEKIKEADEQIMLAYQGLYEKNLSDELRLESMDRMLQKIATDCESKVVKYIKSTLPKDNGFYVMITSGAKGKIMPNLQQIIGIVGQTSIWGSRIPDGYDDRTMPHFHKYDFGLSAKGFIKNSFQKGLAPSEFFFSMMGGRTGLIDTAVRTAETGYISRRLMKAAEDVKVLYDGTVRNASNNIIQFMYGDDNYDPIKLEKVLVNLIKYNDLEMNKYYKYDFDVKDSNLWKNIVINQEIKIDENEAGILENEYNLLMQYRNDLRKNYFKNTDVIDIPVYMPFNLYRFIPTVKFKFGIENNNVSDLHPLDIIKSVNNLCDFVSKYLFDAESNLLTKIMIRSYLSSKMVIMEHKLNKLAFGYIIKELENKIAGAFVQAGEMVGPVAAQSSGEANTQLTLNSIEWNEYIIIMLSNGESKSVKIGQFIDEIFSDGMLSEEGCKKCENYENDTQLYWVKDENYKIMSVDEDGKIRWRKIEAVTRHPVINEDGSKILLKITTQSGRTITATKAKSFLTRKNNKIVATNGSELKVGDRVPIAKTFPLAEKELEGTKVGIEMDMDLGYLLGFYLAIGNYTTFNENDIIFNYQDKNENESQYIKEKIVNFCVRYNMIYQSKEMEIIISSPSLMKLMDKMDMKMKMKTTISLPGFVFSTETGFVKGFLSAYFGCQSYISITNNYISCNMVNDNLADDIINLLLRYNIYVKKVRSNKNGKNIVLKITDSDIITFADNIKLFDIKQDRLNVLRHKFGSNEKDGRIDIIPGNRLNEDENDRNMRRSDLEKILLSMNKSVRNNNGNNNGNNSEMYKIIYDAVYSDVIYDKIIKIEEVRSQHERVYDLTVEYDRNFIVKNGLCLHDTFHQAGAAAGSVVVTAGLPRMKEIINLSKKMKIPSMNLYLKPEYSNKEKAEELKNQVEYTKLKDIVIKSEIIYDNQLGESRYSEDMEFIKLYNEFNEFMCVYSHEEELSKWVLRLEFDRDIMMTRNILMSDIQDAILKNQQKQDAIQCIINDDNSGQLIMRIRVASEVEDENFLSFFIELEKHILNMTLRGVKNVKSANLVETNIIKYDINGSYYTDKEWYVMTNGSNLSDVMLLDNIDKTRSITNDIVETYEIFGIEGARTKIFKELEKIFANEGINQRHYMLLADIMTYRGIIMQIDRHGINRSPDNSVIAKASFEEVTDIFLKAATFAENDKMTGVSANIMFGQLPPIGTNMFDLMFDEEKFMRYADRDQKEQPEYESNEIDENIIVNEINNMYKDVDENLDVKDVDFNFGYNIDNIQEYNIGPIKENIETRQVNVKVIDTLVPQKKMRVKNNDRENNRNNRENNQPKKVMKKIRIKK